jgi:primary-amine oxidase
VLRVILSLGLFNKAGKARGCERTESIERGEWMPLTRHGIATLTLVGLAAWLPAIGAAAEQTRPAARQTHPSAHQTRPPTPNPTLDRERQRRVQEGERASRARPPSPPPASPPNNGIEQIPIDVTRNDGGFADRKPRDAERATGAASTPTCPYKSGLKTASLFKAFPEVSWLVCVTDVGMKALWVGPVYIKRTPTESWMTVLDHAGLAEIFVPYHQTNSRFFDLQYTTRLAQVFAQYAGNNGSLITLTNETVPTVVAELRERGIAFLCSQDSTISRRGQELVIWGVSDAGNYDNIIQFAFRDDGGMSFRTGNTGYNNTGANTSPPPTEPHTHTALWHIVPGLNDGGNRAYWLTHREPYPASAYLKAQDFKTIISSESMRIWDATLFSSLLIEYAMQNAHKHQMGYEFTSVHTGLARHYGWKEAWTEADVYVTAYRNTEFAWMATHMYPDLYVLAYLNGEPTVDKQLVVWIKSQAHHDPADEDKSTKDIGTGGTTGVTLAHWSGINVEPRNLFDTNPLGGPARCGN